MYFPQIMKIKSSDDVLEIGPGAYPFWRSDCLADIYDEHSEIDLTQFGGAKLNTKGKPLFRIVDNVLPFKDNSFDYVICSHVFEHVPHADATQSLGAVFDRHCCLIVLVMFDPVIVPYVRLEIHCVNVASLHTVPLASCFLIDADAHGG